MTFRQIHAMVPVIDVSYSHSTRRPRNVVLFKFWLLVLVSVFRFFSFSLVSVNFYVLVQLIEIALK